MGRRFEPDGAHPLPPMVTPTVLIRCLPERDELESRQVQLHLTSCRCLVDWYCEQPAVDTFWHF